MIKFIVGLFKLIFGKKKKNNQNRHVGPRPPKPPNG